MDSHTPTMPMTIRAWQDMFNEIYGDANRRITDVDAWLHLTEETAEFAHIMRQEKYEDLKTGLPDLFAWLCAFANRTAIDLETALWRKYPRICPFCEKGMNCVCIAEGRRVQYNEKAIKHYIENTNNKPNTFSEWNAMFKDIYGNMNQVLSRDSIGFHLIEEVGQVARNIRAGEPDNYAIEMADVFGWLIAVTMKIVEIGPLDHMTWEVYPGICKTCKVPKCICLEKNRRPKL